MRKNAAAANIVRLVIVLIIALASIACIALDRDRAYFTNVLTLVIGIIVDSPLALRNHSQTPPPLTTSPARLDP